MKKVFKVTLILFIIIIIAISIVVGSHKKTFLYGAKPISGSTSQNKKYYQELWCNQHGGKMDVPYIKQKKFQFRDEITCDCVTKTHAVFINFNKQWAESIGQALNYSRMTEKRGGIVLINQRVIGTARIGRLYNIINEFHLPIDLFIINIK